MKTKLSVNILSLLIAGTDGKILIISGNGEDSKNCGEKIPCRTIGFVLANRANNSDIIKIDNSQLSKPFIISKSFSIPKNITLQGTNGRPTISTESPSQPVYLFEEKELQRVKLITLRIKNLSFRGVGIVRLSDMSSSNISFQNCHIENIDTTHDIIRIECHRSDLHPGLVYFRQCHFINNVAEMAISVLQIHSLFHRCHFENNSLVGKLIFLDGGFSTFKNCCFWKNSLFRKFSQRGGVIYTGTHSVVEIRNCSFIGNEAAGSGGAISSFGRKLIIISSLFKYNLCYGTKMSGGAISSRCDFVLIVNCSFKRNEATFSGGALLAIGRELVIRSSLFENNAAVSVYGKTMGGAICAFSGSSVLSNFKVHILNCSFRENRATYAGGAIAAHF